MYGKRRVGRRRGRQGPKDRVTHPINVPLGPWHHNMFRWLNQQKRIADLQKTFKDLQDRFEGLDSEWTDWYEKLRLLHMRIAKLQARQEQPTPQHSRTHDTNH